MGEISPSPLLEHKDPGAPSVSQPESLLREARRQKKLPPRTSFSSLRSGL